MTTSSDGTRDSSISSINIFRKEDQVTTAVRKRLIDSLIETGATYSVLNTKQGPLSPKTMVITGISEETSHKPFLQPLECHIGKTYLKHSFLYMPECPIPLLGQDLLTELNVQVCFSPEKLDIEVLPDQACIFQAALL